MKKSYWQVLVNKLCLIFESSPLAVGLMMNLRAGIVVRSMRSLTGFAIIMLLSSAMVGCLDALSLNNAPTAQMSVDPNGNVRAGDEITFSAVGSSDSDGDQLTFSWSFGDGDTGTGLTTSHSYSKEGEYVATLTVSDGSHEDTESITINVIDASAREPNAKITDYKTQDCDDEDAPAGSFILIWVCEDDKDINEKEVSVSSGQFTLDGGDSWAGCDPSNSDCYAEEYLVSWDWDLDINTDSDGDGDVANDIDASGESINLEDYPAGAWEIKLTVTDNVGLTDSDETKIYINYRGVWNDFEIDRKYQEAVRLTWEYPVEYDEETVNKIRYLKTVVVYPKEDDNPLNIGGQSVENTLDLYIYNSTDVEVSNTTGIGNDNRNYGDCDEEDRCVGLQIGSGTVRGKGGSGTWTVDLENDQQHNTQVKSLTIILQYR